MQLILFQLPGVLKLLVELFFPKIDIDICATKYIKGVSHWLLKRQFCSHVMSFVEQSWFPYFVIPAPHILGKLNN